MLFTPVIALAGLAAAAPQGLVYRRASNETAPAGFKFSRSTQIVNQTAPAGVKFARSTLNTNDTVPAGVKLVSRSAHNFNGTFPTGTKVPGAAEDVEDPVLSVTPSS